MKNRSARSVFRASHNKMAPVAAARAPIGETPKGGPIHEFYLPKGTARRPVIARSEGIYHWDSDGRKLLDASSGPVVSNLGHGNERVINAMIEQARKSAFATYRTFESEPNVQLAEVVSKLSGLDRAFFVSGGSEAIETAIKLCRQYFYTIGKPEKWKIISRDPSYHGGTLGALGLTGDPAAHKIHEPLLIKHPKVPAPFTYRVPGGKTPEEYEEECLKALEDTIIKEGPENVMAFIVEPIGGLATGALVSSEKHMNGIRQVCNKYGILLIYDEVMSGSGRAGTFLASQMWPNAKPDLVVCAKGLAAGYVPMGACLAPGYMVRAVADASGFNHGHTSTSTPLQCAVALAVIAEVMDRNLMDNAKKMGDLMRKEMTKVMEKSKIVGDIRGVGLLQAVEIVKDRKTKEIFPLNGPVDVLYRFQQVAENKGLLLYVRRTANGKYGGLRSEAQ